MARRVIHDTDYMNFIMTPPVQEEFMNNDVKVDTVRVLDRNRCSSGLGQIPMLSGGGSQQDWVMPVVIIVVSAMALMTLYAVLSKR